MPLEKAKEHMATKGWEYIPGLEKAGQPRWTRINCLMPTRFEAGIKKKTSMIFLVIFFSKKINLLAQQN